MDKAAIRSGHCFNNNANIDKKELSKAAIRSIHVSFPGYSQVPFKLQYWSLKIAISCFKFISDAYYYFVERVR